MSVRGVDTFVLLLPNGEWHDITSTADLEGTVAQLSPSISFSQHLDPDAIQTLSSHNDESTDNTITGFLYIPDLKENDPCANISSQYIPANATRRANLPPMDYLLIALAPWINAECTQAYLKDARTNPTRAFIFYLINNVTDGAAQPPPISSPAWNLHDGGAWKSENPFPVYAVPSNIGRQLIHELSLYSGNMTEVPHGHEISELPNIDPRDYVRMYTEIGVSNSSALPSLWAFLLIIIGVLILMGGVTSATMHLVQRYRRNNLRQRVISGEVDLEALGIKRLTVPQEVIDKLPVFTYNCEEIKLPSPPAGRRSHNHDSPIERNVLEEWPPDSEEITGSQDVSPTSKRASKVTEAASNNSSITPRSLSYAQPTCPVCLDDFETGTTPVRELPCGHIFHPRCIDGFLLRNSSLCPMCKKSVLPKGCCTTQITNSIVRRERNLRRLRSRVTVNEHGGPESSQNRIQNFGLELRRIVLPPSIARAGPETLSHMLARPRLTMGNATAATLPTSILGNEVYLGPGRLTRQQRNGALTTRDLSIDGAMTDARPGSRWRIGLRKVFPGF